MRPCLVFILVHKFEKDNQSNVFLLLYKTAKFSEKKLNKQSTNTKIINFIKYLTFLNYLISKLGIDFLQIVCIKFISYQFVFKIYVQMKCPNICCREKFSNGKMKTISPTYKIQQPCLYSFEFLHIYT